MTFKKSTPILALPFSVVEDVHRVRTVLSLEGASWHILESVTEFASRNILVGKVCCLRCLKAHLLRKAQEEKSSNLVLLIHKVIREEAGHHGYYLDGEEVRKV